MRKLPFVNAEKSRHGKIVYYFRRARGEPRIRLPNDPSSKEFIAAYATALQEGRALEEIQKLNNPPPVEQRLRQRIEASLKRGLCSGHQRAKSKGREFSLDLNWAIAKVEEQKLRCAVTGIRFYENARCETRRHPFAPSFDRIDNSQGYTRGNVRIVILSLNIMLADWGTDVFERVGNCYRNNKSRTSMTPP